MASRFLNTAVAWLRHGAAGIQPLPLAALILVLAAVVAHVVLLPRREAAIEVAERRLAGVEKALRRAALARQGDDVTPATARRRLLAQFQSEAQRNATLGRLLEIAREQGLQIPTGDYRLVPAKSGPLQRYVLNLPVRGQYLAVRRYVAAVRTEFRDLAVEDIALRRENIGAGELEAQLRFVVFARRDEA